MRRYRIYQVDAFTTCLFEGNPAGVVPDADGLSEHEMQAIAGELGNSETAFILEPDGPDHEVRVRFFTPTTEVPSCGHATIAAHYVRAVEAELGTSTVVHKIGAGVLPVGIVREDDDYHIVMTQGAIEFDEPFAKPMRDEILNALGVSEGEWDERCPVQVVSTGHSKVLVGVRGIAGLDALTPDLARLERISARIECNGYYAFVLADTEPRVHGRMFAPAIGIAEDPVTGNANGPLGAYLLEHGLAVARDGVLTFDAMQGVAMGRPGTVRVEVEAEANGSTPSAVRVMGRAVIAFQGELMLQGTVGSLQSGEGVGMAWS